MRFHDLGQLWVSSGGLPQPTQGKRIEAVLAGLLVRLGEVVTTDWMIEAVWGAVPPPRASAALDTLMWRLRRTLDPDRVARAASTVLRTEARGYRLTVPVGSVDSRQFTAAARDVARMDETADAAAILDMTSTALGWWRGRPFDGVEDTGWLAATRNELIENRLTLQQSRIGALLASGQPEQAVSDLVPLLNEHQFAEKLWGLRILGLYRSGRTSAALDAYRDARTLLERELGLEPSPDLQRLQQQILRHDEALTPPTAARPTALAVFRVPSRRSPLFGRNTDIEAVEGFLHQRELVSITGPVGAGKTRLAIAVAGRVRAEYLDGVCFVDLSDVTEPGSVTSRVRSSLGLRTDSTDGSVQSFAEFIGSRRLLIVLDNCEQVVAAVAALVEVILDAGSSTRVLTTSRRPLDVEGEQVYSLLPLGLPIDDSPEAFTASPAVQLFTRRLTGSVPGEVTDAERAVISRICAATDGLPLSLELAAARARIFQLHEVAATIIDHPMTLEYPTTDNRPHREVTLRGSIESSHRLLPEDGRIAHRRLSVLPPRFTLEAAVAACDGAIPPDRVVAAMTAVAHHSLLESSGPDRPNGPTLFRQLVPIRAHAAEKLSDAGEIREVQAALHTWMVGVIAERVRLGQHGQAGWYQRLDDNWRSVAVTLEFAISIGPLDETLMAVIDLVAYWIDRMIIFDALSLTQAAVAACGPGNSRFATTAASAAYGIIRAVNQDTVEVREVLDSAIVELAGSAADHRLAAADILLLTSVAVWVGDDYELAGRAALAAAGVVEQLDDPNAALICGAVSCLQRLWSDPAGAAASALVVLAENRKVANDFASLLANITLSIAALLSRDGAAGLQYTHDILVLQHRMGVRSVADTLETRGNHHVNAGNPAEAIRCYGAAHLQNAQMGRGWPRHPGTEQLLDVARGQLSAGEFAEAWDSGRRVGASSLVVEWL